MRDHDDPRVFVTFEEDVESLLANASFRYSWTSWMAADPSPTAVAGGVVGVDELTPPVLAGWELDIPALKSILPGPVRRIFGSFEHRDRVRHALGLEG